ncbi:MAG: Gfo/Idh/MocA family protein, partial [Longimicrobiales bacterium]
MADPDIDTVFILTRHDTHANLAMRALQAGKHVFVEKPLALTHDELNAVRAAAAESDRLLTVGFNRRFAPLTVEMAGLLARRIGPVSIVITVNAGAVPPDHWVQHPVLGGGRIVGEACHFIDLARALTGAPIASCDAVAARGRDGRPIDDIAHLTLSFADGSTAVVHYLANGSRAFPKERIEAFFDGRTCAIDNWRRLHRYGT